MVELAKQYKVIIVVVILFIITMGCQTILFSPNNDIELIRQKDSNDFSNEQIYCEDTNTNSIYNNKSLISNQGDKYKDELKNTSYEITLDTEDEKKIVNPTKVTVTPNVITDKITVIPVYICGEIVNPGVYNVNSDKLINDVVNLAGGLTEDANLRGINLAEVVSANDMIIIPTIGENVPEVKINTDDLITTESSEILEYESLTYKTSNLININTANKDALMSLPGIGEVKAQAIIDYRESVSTFMSISDIKEVSGIGDKTFEKLAELITV